MKIVDVAVGVIKRNKQIYISKRADELHQGGLWEFPGGKCEGTESVEQALSRELREEIAIQLSSQAEFLLIEHDYGDKKVRLHVRLVDNFVGEPVHQEGQIGQWVDIDKLHNFAFPAANTGIVEKLQKQY